MTEVDMAAYGAADWAAVFVPDASLLESFIRGSVVYLSILILFRAVLRRQAGSIGLPDIMLVVLISECVSAALSAEAKSVPNGLAAVAALLFWSYFLDWLGHRWPWFQRLLEPQPLALVRDGKPLRENLDHERITDEELEAQLRLGGVVGVARVKLATLEADGEVSVIPKEGEGQAECANCRSESLDLSGAAKHFEEAAEKLRAAVARHEEHAVDHKAAAKAARELLARHGIRPAKFVTNKKRTHATEKPR